MSTEVERLMTEAAELAKNDKSEAAIEKYKAVIVIDKKNIEAQFQIGELYHKIGNLPDALSAYLHTTDIDPEHKKANVKIEMIKSIMDFFNPDLYNP
ncbi:tetratricopeptide repeat protein [Marinifilum caeruleilacunae]|uniref:Tetratricopeptide repeat protein n=1 Tax=Marinifilum caeruleilacunae TaxID=2499076 RepID=A0ABX1WV63_9BACT|nr:tetratricopeptide repeat protein [Marinifilum caeruleilacunae]NOU59998.1 tetratricopeptide repeat protein [Marinifilum caeruleilacunae]